MTEEQPAKPEEAPPAGGKTLSLASVVQILTWFGILDVAIGLFHLTAGMVSGFTPVVWRDFLFNTGEGVLVFASSRLLARRKLAGFWLFIGCMLFSMVYSFWMGRGVNVVTAIFGGYLIWMLFNLQKQGELS